MIVNVHVAVSSANIRRSPGGECAVVKNQSLKWYRQISHFIYLIISVSAFCFYCCPTCFSLLMHVHLLIGFLGSTHTLTNT